MISRIYADNYRCFTNFTFEPKRLNLLVGDNGSGKSSLVALVVDLQRLARSSDALRVALGPDTLTRWSTRTSQRFELTFRQGPVSWEWTLALGFDDWSERMAIQKETVSKDGVLVAELEGGSAKKLRIGADEVAIPYELQGSLLALRHENRELRTFHDLVLRTTGLKLDVSAILDGAPARESEAFLNADGSNFAASYRATRDKDFEKTRRLHDKLKECIGGFRSLEFEDLGPDAKRLVVKLFTEKTRPDYTLGFNELSDGQRALAVLHHLTTTFDLARRSLFIDEPDNYVGVRELGPWLQSLSAALDEQDAQAFIISHNPEVIDYLAADHAWLFERDDGGPVRVRPLPVERQSGLKASEQLARGWIHGA